MSRRWIIRGTCLGLLGMCVSLWGVSYLYSGAIVRASGKHRSTVSAVVDRGVLMVDQTPCRDLLPEEVRWVGGWGRVPRDGTLRLHLLDGDFLGFTVYEGESWWYGIEIPFWCPTALLGLVSWIAWRKTRQLGPGFPVGALVSQDLEKRSRAVD